MADETTTGSTVQVEIDAKTAERKKYIKWAIIVVALVGVFWLVKKYVIK